jgi:hypothetical protein
MKTLLIALIFVASFCNNSARAQLKKSAGQAGINPGTSLYFIAHQLRRSVAERRILQIRTWP